MNYQLSERLTSLPFSEIRTVMERAMEIEKSGTKVIHLELGRPDFDTPSFIKEACQASLDKGHVHYTSNYGLPALREAIAEKLNRENGIPYSSKQILVTVGVSEAIFCALGSLINPGDEILIPNPVWLNYMHVTRHFAGVPVSYYLREENQYSLDINEIKSKITPRTRIVVIVSPNNPTGGVLSESDLNLLADVVKRYNLLVLSDEVYEKIVYDDIRHISIASLPGMLERTVTLNGFSKAYSMTGWRLGYMAAPESIIQAAVRMHMYMTTCATSFVQEAAIMALTSGEDSIQTMVAEYKHRRDFVVRAINRIQGLSCLSPKGAFYIFVNIKNLNIRSTDFTSRLLEEAKIAMVPGSAFGEAGEGYVRLSYAASFADLVTACDRLEAFIKELVTTQNN